MVQFVADLYAITFKAKYGNWKIEHNLNYKFHENPLMPQGCLANLCLALSPTFHEIKDLVEEINKIVEVFKELYQTNGDPNQIKDWLEFCKKSSQNLKIIDIETQKEITDLWYLLKSQLAWSVIVYESNTHPSFLGEVFSLIGRMSGAFSDKIFVVLRNFDDDYFKSLGLTYTSMKLFQPDLDENFIILDVQNYQYLKILDPENVYTVCNVPKLLKKLEEYDLY